MYKYSWQSNSIFTETGTKVFLELIKHCQAGINNP